MVESFFFKKDGVGWEGSTFLSSCSFLFACCQACQMSMGCQRLRALGSSRHTSGYDPRRRRPRNWGNDIDSMELQQFLPLCLLVFVGVTDGRKKIRRNGWVGYKIRHHCLLWNISFVCLRRLFYQYTMVNHHWSAAIWRASFTKNPTTFKQI